MTPEIAFLDFEASSKDLISSFPIEVGICLQNGEPSSWLIKPLATWTDWSEEAEAVHGITRNRLQDEGNDPAAVAKQLNALLPPRVYCDALSFDAFWLHRLYRAADEQPAFSLESIGSLLPAHLLDQWSATRDDIFSELDLIRHRAASDAKVLFLTWQQLTRRDTGDDPRR